MPLSLLPLSLLPVVIVVPFLLLPLFGESVVVVDVEATVVVCC